MVWVCYKAKLRQTQGINNNAVGEYSTKMCGGGQKKELMRFVAHQLI